MKRTNPRGRAALPAVLSSATLAFGQGQVRFVNTSDTLISTNGWHLGPALGPTSPYPGSGGPQFIYALFAAPSTVTSVSGVMDPDWTLTGAYATNWSSNAGHLAGGDAVLPPPYVAGSTWNFLVRGWSAEVGGMDWTSVQAFVHTFEDDPNAVGSPGQLFGTSGIATLEPSGGLNPPTMIFGTIPGITIQGFLLDQVPIPEPPVFALLALGGAALTVFRCRGSALQPEGTAFDGDGDNPERP